MISSKVYQYICTIKFALTQHIVALKNMHGCRGLSKSNTAMETAELVMSWWAPTYIATKAKVNLNIMILKLDDEWCNLNKFR